MLFAYPDITWFVGVRTLDLVESVPPINMIADYICLLFFIKPHMAPK